MAALPLPIGLQEAVYEDVPVGTVILTVTASDADSGNFAVIEYSLVDGEGKFAINPTTVSGQWRAWVWEWGVQWAQGHRLRGHQKYCGFPLCLGPAAWRCVISEVFSSVSPVLRVPDILAVPAGMEEVAKIFGN